MLEKVVAPLSVGTPMALAPGRAWGGGVTAIYADNTLMVVWRKQAASRSFRMSRPYVNIFPPYPSFFLLFYLLHRSTKLRVFLYLSFGVRYH